MDKSEIKPEEVKSKFRREAYSRSHNHANTRSIVAPEEDLFPGLAYVAIAGLTGSFAARQGMDFLLVSLRYNDYSVVASCFGTLVSPF